MNDGKRFMSLLVDRKINTKVALGFATVLALLAIVSGISYFSFNASADGFTTYAQRVRIVGIARDIDRGFVNLRRFVREYAFTTAAANIESARREQANLRVLLDRGMTEIRNPERRRRLEDIAQALDTYLADFDKVVGWTADQVKIQESELQPLGARQIQNIDALIAAAGAKNDHDVVALANDGLKRVLLGRLSALRMLRLHETSLAKDVEKAFTDLAAVLQNLDNAIKDAVDRETLQKLRAASAGYRDAFAKAAALEQKISGAVNGTMIETAQKVQDDAEAIRDSGIAEQKQEEATTLATMDRTSTVILTLLSGGLLLGAGLSWLIGRGISRPIVRIAAAMRELAKGDTSVAIPGIGRGDEVGEMASTMQVFKDSMAETERLRAEQEVRKRQAQEERRAALSRLADTFEGQVGGVVQAVSAATTQLQVASKHMEENAARTSAEATSVSSASAQAAANAQAVASASEQLTASISEIGKQVENARLIAGRADDEASQTTEQVRKLSQTVNAIGAIVALINDVASQTNLLALNATIEAARAGDAGKGFAVVASEVKNLANQTAKATDEIAGKIAAVQSGTEDAAKAISSITKVMSQMSAISTAIAAAVEQQSSATAEIARNVEQSAAGTHEVSARIAKVDDAARETGITANAISGSATELSTQARTLRTEVGRFLEQVRSDKETVRVLSWDDAWTTGVREIDAHHRQFLDEINKFFTELVNGEGRESVPRAADLVARSIAPHFAEEENRMRQAGYPDLAAHQRDHASFLGRFREFTDASRADGTIDPGAFFDFVSGWYRNHMRDHDGPFAQFLRAGTSGKQAA